MMLRLIQMMLLPEIVLSVGGDTGIDSSGTHLGDGTCGTSGASSGLSHSASGVGSIDAYKW